MCDNYRSNDDSVEKQLKNCRVKLYNNTIDTLFKDNTDFKPIN